MELIVEEYDDDMVCIHPDKGNFPMFTLTNEEYDEMDDDDLCWWYSCMLAGAPYMGDD